MKFANIKWLVVMLLAPLFTACDWQDLPAYSEAEISAVQFEYRWEGSRKDPITGEAIVESVQLNVTSDVDSDNAVVNATVKVPAANTTFTESVRNSVSQSKLWVKATVSTAARVTPMEGTNPMGTPDDWTKDHKFNVMAADGSSKVWTIRIVQFSK